MLDNLAETIIHIIQNVTAGVAQKKIEKLEGNRE